MISTLALAPTLRMPPRAAPASFDEVTPLALDDLGVRDGLVSISQQAWVHSPALVLQ